MSAPATQGGHNESKFVNFVLHNRRLDENLQRRKCIYGRKIPQTAWCPVTPFHPGPILVPSTMQLWLRLWLPVISTPFTSTWTNLYRWAHLPSQSVIFTPPWGGNFPTWASPTSKLPLARYFRRRNPRTLLESRTSIASNFEIFLTTFRRRRNLFFQFWLQIFRRRVGISSHFFICCFYFLFQSSS